MLTNLKLTTSNLNITVIHILINVQKVYNLAKTI